MLSARFCRHAPSPAAAAIRSLRSANAVMHQHMPFARPRRATAVHRFALHALARYPASRSMSPRRANICSAESSLIVAALRHNADGRFAYLRLSRHAAAMSPRHRQHYASAMPPPQTSAYKPPDTSPAHATLRERRLRTRRGARLPMPRRVRCRHAPLPMLLR